MLNLLAYIMYRTETKTDAHYGDIRNRKSKLQWFNPVTNMKKLLFFRSTNGDLSSLHGIRAITILWIVAGHALDWNALNMFRSTFTIRDRFGELLAQPFFKAYYAVDTFFLLRYTFILSSYFSSKHFLFLSVDFWHRLSRSSIPEETSKISAPSAMF